MTLTFGTVRVAEPQGLETSPAWSLEGMAIHSVATAGDVNGDGYSDVIVGAPLYDNGQENEGRALVYYGSPTGLATSPSWAIESNQSNAEFGSSVAAAGDVNRDGYHDVIVGADSYSNGQNREGRAFVYLGSATGLATSPVWTQESNQEFGYYGSTVASAGDINGDGCSDVIVGAYLYDHGETNEGRVYVYLGSANGPSPTAQWTAESNQAQASLGFSLAGCDINADGYSDVVIGAPNYQLTNPGEGRVFAYYGTVNGLPTSPNWFVTGSQGAAYFGHSLAAAGDVNRDGYSDVIIGAPQHSNGQGLEGRAFLYVGSSIGLRVTPSWIMESNQVGAHFGTSVATAGDVDGDGFADAIFGADEFDNGLSDQGRAVLFYGAYPTFDTTPAWSVDGNQASAGFGNVVATAGDVNGDGFADVIVKAFGTGAAYVYHGSGKSLHPVEAFRHLSPQDGTRFGHSVALAGDVNGDIHSDNIVGAPAFGQDQGRAYIYNVGNGLLWTADGGQDFAQFGNSVSTAGDVNGDGFSDVIVGANLYDNGQLNEGRVFVYYGANEGPASSPSWTAESNQAFAEFGYSVATAGDVNGDGFSDVIIGAYAYDNGQDDEGRVFVYHGSAAGLPASPSWTVESNQAVSGFGTSVATAGDVNRDGFSDVIVGAYLYDNGQTNEGRVFVYHGSASGLATSPSWRAESNQAISDFGISVATAGDVNGDGFSDVIVGAASYDNGQDGEGRAFVYLGSSGGLGAAPAWTAESNQIAAQFGYSVSTAGDVNGDGFSDVVIGAPFYSNGELNEGKAFTYHGSAGGPAANPSWTGEGNEGSASFGWAVASGGDLNGDGFSDVIAGAPLRDEAPNDDAGGYFAYYGNWSPAGGFLVFYGRRIGQARVDNTGLIQSLGNSDYQNAFRLHGVGVSAGGRARVWLEWEVKPLGVPFDGQDIVSGRAFDTGAPDGMASMVPITDLVYGLVNNTRYCWRVRIASHFPFFPRTPWLIHPGNALTETDLRTTGLIIGMADPAPPTTPLFLELIHPNPIGSSADIVHSLPETGSVRLAVYDVQGRLRAILDRGTKPAGRHAVRWEGRALSGNSLEAGVYFVRLELGNRTETRKLVWAP